MQSETNNRFGNEQQALKALLARHAFHHLNEIDARTGTILIKTGVISGDYAGLENEYGFAVLSSSDHPDRIQTGFGPIIAHYAKGDKEKALVIEVAPLLLNSDRKWRIAAYNHFVSIVGGLRHPQPERLQSLLRQTKELLFSEAIESWGGTAITLFDAIVDDFFLNLAAFKQCLRLNYNPGLNVYFSKLIKPPLSSVEFIELSVPLLSKQHAEIDALIRKIATEADCFSSACEMYYREVGDVPLAPSFGMSRVLDEWLVLKREYTDIWQETWQWANATMSPVARYHACQLFGQHPNFVPEEKHQDLWSEICEIITPIKKSTAEIETKWTQEWMLRCELAQHYLKYFECQRPGRNSEPVVRLAWWLSEQVASAFVGNTDLIKELRATGIRKAMAEANFAWQSANPVMEPCSIRYATLFLTQPWSLALELHIGKKLSALRFAEIDPQKRAHFEQAVGESLSFWFPPAPLADSVTYPFDVSPIEAANNVFCLMENQDQQVSFFDLLSMREGVEENKGLLEALSKITELDQGTQALAILALRCRAHLNGISPDEVWKIVGGDTWQSVLMTLDSNLLQTLFDSLNALQAHGGDVLRCNLPHLFAKAAEAASKDRKRQQILFLFTVLSSISGDTVSAIERVLKGRYRQEFTDDVALWRTQFTKIMQLSPPWIAARIRPILLSLSIV
ncbi:MAG: hypothetical protein H0X66_12255 [Verrucomicrobia bacterium]|nr:hypothetical protein [Verrucomicrobiota bacterium]